MIQLLTGDEKRLFDQQLAEALKEVTKTPPFFYVPRSAQIYYAMNRDFMLSQTRSLSGASSIYSDRVLNNRMNPYRNKAVSFGVSGRIELGWLPIQDIPWFNLARLTRPVEPQVWKVFPLEWVAEKWRSYSVTMVTASVIFLPTRSPKDRYGFVRFSPDEDGQALPRFPSLVIKEPLTRKIKLKSQSAVRVSFQFGMLQLIHTKPSLRGIKSPVEFSGSVHRDYGYYPCHPRMQVFVSDAEGMPFLTRDVSDAQSVLVTITYRAVLVTAELRNGDVLPRRPPTSLTKEQAAELRKRHFAHRTPKQDALVRLTLFDAACNL